MAVSDKTKNFLHIGLSMIYVVLAGQDGKYICYIQTLRPTQPLSVSFFASRRRKFWRGRRVAALASMANAWRKAMKYDPQHIIQLAHDRQTHLVNPRSAQAYRVDVARLGRLRKRPEDAAECRHYYYRLVAALTYVAALRVRQLTPVIRALDQELTADQELDLQAAAWALTRYQPVAPDLAAQPDRPLTSRHVNNLPRSGARSKKRVARALSRSKRERDGALFAAALRQGIAPAAIALTRVTGVMPTELAAGVRINRVGGGLHVFIEGAKVSQTFERGQDWRVIELELTMPETDYLARCVPHDGDEYVVQCSYPRLYRALRWAAIEGLGKRLGRRVSPYAYRHMVTATLRKVLSRYALACTRGDRSTLTAKHYGGGCRAGGISAVPVDWCHDVRDPIGSPSAHPLPEAQAKLTHALPDTRKRINLTISKMPLAMPLHKTKTPGGMA